jgi:flagellar export protein FliJ
MKPFRFRLDRVLRVREVEEEIARAAWLTVESAAQAAEHRADALAEDRAAAFAALASDMAERSLPPAETLLRHASLDRLAGSVGAERERALTLRQQADQAREPWQDRRREVLGLSRLRDAAKSRHSATVLAEEIAEMDEVASTRAARQLRASPGGARSDSAVPHVPTAKDS